MGGMGMASFAPVLHAKNIQHPTQLELVGFRPLLWGEQVVGMGGPVPELPCIASHDDLRLMMSLS